jgi:hypothetical protein
MKAETAPYRNFLRVRRWCGGVNGRVYVGANDGNLYAYGL